MVRTAQAVLLIAVVIISAELTARVDDKVRRGISVFSQPSWDVTLMRRDSTLLTGRPHARKGAIRLNAYGFRGPDLRDPLPPGCVRIMAIGASETFDENGRVEDYPRLLENQLRDHGCFEVLNAAIVGQALPRLQHTWEHHASRVAPSIVIIYPTPSFYLRDVPPAYPTDVLHDPPTRPWWHPRVLVWLEESTLGWPQVVRTHLLRRELSAAADTGGPGWVYSELPLDRLAVYERQLDSIATAVAQRNAIPVLVTHATRFDRPPAKADLDILDAFRHNSGQRATRDVILAFEDSAAAATRRLAARRGYPLVDAAAKMNGRGELFSDFMHFTPAGGHTMARLLAAKVLEIVRERSFPQPPGVSARGAK
ncbi:MAG TPA: hypothetical protein VFM14_05665 [Gemmatimonadales bacterium]|nr:hypothetical protein [Gemmatimonadales bacterium]